ncbi:hypothetical protein E2320_001029, partial [Naja naja]
MKDMMMMFWLIVLILFFPAIESNNYHLMELHKPSGEEAVRLRRTLGPCLPNPCFHQGTTIQTAPVRLALRDNSVKVNGSHVSYANVIESDREDNGVITRSNAILIHFSCIYAYKRVVSLQYSLKAMDTFKKPYSQQPLSLLMSDTLYVLLQIEGQDQVKYFFLSVEDCWGTPTNDPDDSTKHYLIMKGTVAKFSFQMFQFKNLSEVFLHCQVRLCIPANQEPCVKQCPIKQRNKRQLEDDYMKVVSYGPIVFAAPSHLETRNANGQLSFSGSQ